jgi:protein gp37
MAERRIKFADEKWVPPSEGDFDQPLRWRKPKRILVMGDLFEDDVPDEWIDRVFAVMALAPQHTFLVLSKRPARMRDYLKEVVQSGRWLIWPHPTFGHDIFAPEARWEVMTRHIWPGVSVEDQARANERIPILLDTPAAVRWISAEPMLGAIDLAGPLYRGEAGITMRGYLRDKSEPDDFHYHARKLDWIVAGAESGPGARPCNIEWIRSLRDQCAAAGVPFFFKQHVENGRQVSLPMLDGVTHNAFPEVS